MRQLRIYSDTNALKERIRLNTSGAAENLEDWIFSIVSPREQTKILDLGCGTGKQIFALNERLHGNCEITGLDLSADAVAAVNERAIRQDSANISACQGSLDDSTRIFSGKSFDLVISTYAIYYASDLPDLLVELKTLLKSSGMLFVCGYGSGSNNEIFSILRRGFTNAEAENAYFSALLAEDFISEPDINMVSKSFSGVETRVLNNKVNFETAESVMAWWKNHSTYAPELASFVQEELRCAFKSKGEFSITKNVLGVLYRA